MSSIMEAWRSDEARKSASHFVCFASSLRRRLLEELRQAHRRGSAGRAIGCGPWRRRWLRARPWPHPVARCAVRSAGRARMWRLRGPRCAGPGRDARLRARWSSRIARRSTCAWWSPGNREPQMPRAKRPVCSTANTSAAKAGIERYCMCCPPLMAILAPVRNAASSDARYAQSPATSSGLPRRPMGICGMIFDSSTSLGIASTILVPM